MEAAIHLAVWALGLFGGASVLENTLENYLMNQPWMPTWAKGLVVPVISTIGGVIASVYGGLPLDQAIAGALTLGGAATALHNHPDFTSAELPPPPVDALGVPGDPPVVKP